MARSGPLLTEAQRKKIAPLLPKPPRHRKGGRPWIQSRRVLEGILWILLSGARWQDLPEKYPHPICTSSRKVCHRAVCLYPNRGTVKLPESNTKHCRRVVRMSCDLGK